MLLVQALPAKAGLKAGQPAPEFKLPDLKGKQHSLAELRKNGHVLLIFWAVECVYCYAHIKDFKALHEKYSQHGLTLAAINIGAEYPEDVAEYVKDNAIPYLTLADRLNNLDAAEAYQAQVTPTMVVVSPASKILYYGYRVPDMSQWIKK